MPNSCPCAWDISQIASFLLTVQGWNATQANAANVPGERRREQSKSIPLKLLDNPASERRPRLDPERSYSRMSTALRETTVFSYLNPKVNTSDKTGCQAHKLGIWNHLC